MTSVDFEREGVLTIKNSTTFVVELTANTNCGGMKIDLSVNTWCVPPKVVISVTSTGRDTDGPGVEIKTAVYFIAYFQREGEQRRFQYRRIRLILHLKNKSVSNKDV